MFEDKIKKLRSNMMQEEVDAVFISSTSNISYLSGYSNFSKDEREAYIFIGQDFGYIITDGRYSEAVKKQVPHLTLFEIGNKKGIDELFKKHKVKNLGIEEDNLTVVEHKKIKKHFKKIKHIEVSKLRSVKNKDEIGKIAHACKIGDLAFNYILKKLRVGVTEKEIAYELEKFVKEKGAEFSFSPIVAFGKNSSVPHHQTGDTKLENNQFVLIDMGVKFENYCSDMTRTMFFGKPSEKQREIYETVLKAQLKAVDFVNQQIKLAKKITEAEVDKIARNYIISKGYSSIPHSLGHGIGLEVHEQPHLSVNSKEELKIGMVFSIEPGIYIEGYGGVRIEDLYVYEKKGLKQITKSSKQLFSI